MHMSDQREIAAPVSEVWAALLSAESLMTCVPGAKEVTGNAEDGFEATVVQKVGPVKATFKGQVTLTNMVEGQSLTLTGAGKGGAAGFAKGVADVSLAPSETGTLLSYEVDAKVGGKMAQLGSRLIDGFAKKMADQFFSNLQETLEGPSADAVANPEADTSVGDGGTEASDGEKKGLFKRLTGG